MASKTMRKAETILLERIKKNIFIIRNQKVMLSNHLGELSGVETRALVQAVKRNADRFPRDFMFQLSKTEFTNLKSQIVISSWGGAKRSLSYAFTEQGINQLISPPEKPKKKIGFTIEE